MAELSQDRWETEVPVQEEEPGLSPPSSSISLQAQPLSAEEIHQQLSITIQKLIRLIDVYTERAVSSEIVRETSAKDAVAVIKTAAEAVKILQAPIPHLFGQSQGGNGGSDNHRESPPSQAHSRVCRESSANSAIRSQTSPAPRFGTKYTPLDAFFDEILKELIVFDPETAKLEPWARLLLRCDSLVKKLEKKIMEFEERLAKSSRENEKDGPTDLRPDSLAHQPESLSGGTGACPADAKAEVASASEKARQDSSSANEERHANKASSRSPP